MDFIIDTNVPLTAHGAAVHMSEDCKLTCSEFLSKFLEEDELLVIDSELKILAEYRDSMTYEGANSIGRQFVKWVLNNFANPQRIKQVSIADIANDNYSGLLDDFDEFDPADKKFLATAIMNGTDTVIVQATDGKWLDWETEFVAAGIDVRYPCHDELAG
jgi:hypothetical protein